ncbi:MAG: DUF1987 domain-containing protein [Bacteroidia bacterium]|nr:DUF1987 domain-containing protein [Bacteroidia bacterium]
MQKLYIKSSRITPEIYLSPDENIFSIKGVSAPEDVRTLYYPVIEWVKIFVDDILEGVIKTFNNESPIRLQIDLSYFNSSSAKFLYDIFMEFKRLKVFKVPMVVEWFHETEDRDMLDAGSDLSQLVEMEFTYISKSKNEK